MTATGRFAHLHTHTEYSMLDGAARIGDLVAAAAADGQPGLAVTDHGNMYGVLDFYRAARDQLLSTATDYDVALTNFNAFNFASYNYPDANIRNQ